MFYVFSNEGLEEYPQAPLSISEEPGRYHVYVVDFEELKEQHDMPGISEYTVKKFAANAAFFQNTVEVFDDFTCGMLTVVDVFSLETIRRQIGFILTKDVFVLVKFNHEDIDTVVKNAASHIHSRMTMEKVICSILDRILVNGNEEIRFTEGIISALEYQIEKKKIDKSINEELFDLRNRISTLKDFADQLVDIGENLESNTNNMLEDEGEMHFLKNLIRKAERMKERACMLSDSLIYLRELLEVELDNKLNNTMNVLTIVTIIFQPAGIIAGWYGMNFINMPELKWEFGYVYVILLNIAIVLGLFHYFRRKKML